MRRFGLIISALLVCGVSIAAAPISRLSNFANDSANAIPISSAKVDAELNQLVAAINLTCVQQGSTPSSPTNGTCWWDTTNKALKFYRNNEWINFSPVYGGTSYPGTPQKGDFFSNWNNPNLLQTYNGTNWVNAGLVTVNSTNINWIDINSYKTINGSGAINWQSIPGDASGNYLQSNGNNTVNWTNVGFVPRNIQIFTSSGTWTKPANVSNVYVKVWGAGGSGGGANQATYYGGGGGAGGYSEGYTNVTTNVTVTVGTGGTHGTGLDGSGCVNAGTAGGTSSFAGTTTIQATGGSPGGSGCSAYSYGSGGAGGVGSNGSINFTGNSGYANPSILQYSVNGGISPFAPLNNVNGQDKFGLGGFGYGGGGGGAKSTGSQAIAGDGANGLVIVYY